MRCHLDEFARLLQTLTLASHADQSDYVCGLAVRLEEAQRLLAELFCELSKTTTEGVCGEAKGTVYLVQVLALALCMNLTGNS